MSRSFSSRLRGERFQTRGLSNFDSRIWSEPGRNLASFNKFARNQGNFDARLDSLCSVSRTKFVALIMRRGSRTSDTKSEAQRLRTTHRVKHTVYFRSFVHSTALCPPFLAVSLAERKNRSVLHGSASSRARCVTMKRSDGPMLDRATDPRARRFKACSLVGLLMQWNYLKLLFDTIEQFQAILRITMLTS